MPLKAFAYWPSEYWPLNYFQNGYWPGFLVPALQAPGYWPSTFWARGFYDDGYWPDYGTMSNEVIQPQPKYALHGFNRYRVLQWGGRFKPRR